MPDVQLGLLGLLSLVLVVYAAFNVIGSNASTLAKTLWMVALIAFPFVGFIAWLVFGPRSPR